MLHMKRIKKDCEYEANLFLGILLAYILIVIATNTVSILTSMPLHVACRHCPDNEVIRMLLEANPNALHSRTRVC